MQPIEPKRTDEQYLRDAIRRSREQMEGGRGGPFGAIIVRDGSVVGRGANRVTTSLDPTAHAEIVAIRNACRRLASFSLAGAALYASCEPCPMCLAAAYWARLDRVVYGASREDAAAAGFDDRRIYDELEVHGSARSLPMTQLLHSEAASVLQDWTRFPGRVPY